MRWVKQTDFTNEEAIGYLADRLAKLGVENELFKQGAKPGDMVVIGEDDGVVFDWEPTMMAGAELLAAPRGTDVRFADIGDRPTRGQKRDEQIERREAKLPPAQNSKPNARPASGPNPSADAGPPSRSRRVDWAQQMTSKAVTERGAAVTPEPPRGPADSRRPPTGPCCPGHAGSWSRSDRRR